jgi:hypothetical protein
VNGHSYVILPDVLFTFDEPVDSFEISGFDPLKEIISEIAFDTTIDAYAMPFDVNNDVILSITGVDSPSTETSVPEPDTLSLSSLGVILLGFLGYRRRAP